MLKLYIFLCWIHKKGHTSSSLTYDPYYINSNVPIYMIHTQLTDDINYPIKYNNRCWSDIFAIIITRDSHNKYYTKQSYSFVTSVRTPNMLHFLTIPTWTYPVFKTQHNHFQIKTQDILFLFIYWCWECRKLLN